jgi:selenide,water dikinase
VFDRALELASEDAPSGSRAKLKAALAAGAHFGHIHTALQLVLADAQTSGGLLMSVPETRVESLMNALRARGVTSAAIIGRIVEGSAILVR